MQKGENERTENSTAKQKSKRRKNAKATRETMYCPDEKSWITMAEAEKKVLELYRFAHTPSVVCCRLERISASEIVKKLPTEMGNSQMS